MKNKMAASLASEGFPRNSYVQYMQGHHYISLLLIPREAVWFYSSLLCTVLECCSAFALVVAWGHVWGQFV